jgi:hypothetical protein
MVAKTAIDGMRGGSFDGFHDLNQRDDETTCFVRQGRENEVHVVWHDYGHMQSILGFMIVETAGQSDVTRAVGKSPAEFSDERDEVRFVVALQVRQVAPVEGHGIIILSQAADVLSESYEKCALIPEQERVGADALVRPRWKYDVLYGRAGASTELKLVPGRGRPGLRDL